MRGRKGEELAHARRLHIFRLTSRTVSKPSWYFMVLPLAPVFQLLCSSLLLHRHSYSHAGNQNGGLTNTEKIEGERNMCPFPAVVCGGDTQTRWHRARGKVSANHCSPCASALREKCSLRLHLPARKK